MYVKHDSNLSLKYRKHIVPLNQLTRFIMLFFENRNRQVDIVLRNTLGKQIFTVGKSPRKSHVECGE